MNPEILKIYFHIRNDFRVISIVMKNEKYYGNYDYDEYMRSQKLNSPLSMNKDVPHDRKFNSHLQTSIFILILNFD